MRDALNIKLRFQSHESNRLKNLLFVFRMESFTQENTDLKRKLQSMESTNKTLAAQLQKLQSIVNKVTKPLKANSTQSGTCLMVRNKKSRGYDPFWNLGFGFGSGPSVVWTITRGFVRVASDETTEPEAESKDEALFSKRAIVGPSSLQVKSTQTHPVLNRAQCYGSGYQKQRICVNRSREFCAYFSSMFHNLARIFSLSEVVHR